MVRQLFLVQCTVGSNPTIPASFLPCAVRRELALIQRDLALLPGKNGTFIILGEFGSLLSTEVALLFVLKSCPRTVQPVGPGFGTQVGKLAFAAQILNVCIDGQNWCLWSPSPSGSVDCSPIPVRAGPHVASRISAEFRLLVQFLVNGWG